MNSLWLFIFAAFFLATSAVVHAEDCSFGRLERIRRSAQRLEPEAHAEGTRYARNCAQGRDELLLWMAYYYRSRGEYHRMTELLDLVPAASVRGSERDRVLSKAITGDASDLRDRVSRGEPGYANDAEALLVLARASARERRFGEARAAYAEYLKAKPNDREIEIEEAYTWLWEGSGQQAEERFRAIRKKGGLSEAQRASVDQGISSASAVEVAVTRPIPLIAPTLSIMSELWSSTFYGFTRASSGGIYRGESLMGSAHVHWFTSSKPGVERYAALEGNVGAGALFENRLAVFGRVGAFAATQTVFLFDAMAEYRLRGGATPYAGAYRGALAKDVPLPGDLSGRAKSAVLAGFRYRSIADARFETRSYEGFTSSNYFSARFGFPFREISGVGAGAGSLSGTLHAENESFTAVSEHLYSPRTMTALRLGGEYMADFSELVSGRLNFNLGSVFESSRAPASLSYGARASLMGVGAEIGYRATRDMLATFRTRYDRTNGDDGRASYGAILIGFELGWTLGGGEP